MKILTGQGRQTSKENNKEPKKKEKQKNDKEIKKNYCL